MFHRVHHDDADINVTTALRFHIVEMVLETLVRAAFLVVTGVDLGTMLLCQGVVSLFVPMHHTNTPIYGERWLAKVFIVPRLHRVHHSALREEHDSNYGSVFSLWDRLFGTIKELEPAAIGLPPNRARGFVGTISGGWQTLAQIIKPPMPALIPVRANRHPASAQVRSDTNRHGMSGL